MSDLIKKKKLSKKKKHREKIPELPEIKIPHQMDRGIISAGWKSAIKNLTTQHHSLSEVSDEQPETESSEEELDLTKECYPIAHYMNDRAEMINQMFSVIKGKKLKAMLPPILADIDTEQLKLLCLDQLLGISEKRIQCILEGEILDSSSESEVISEESDSSSSSEGSSPSSHNESHRGSSRSLSRKRGKKPEDESGKAAKVAKVAEVEPQKPDEGKTLLEILELEMRARAIRALLNQGNSSSKTGNGDIVDLTEPDDEFPRVIKTEPVTSEQEQSFEDKVEKTAKAKSDDNAKNDGSGKTQRLLLETEMRNRLIKKKTYRTRQQRIENEEESTGNREKQAEGVAPIVQVKQEPSEEPMEILIEDPEEGEVSSEEEPEVPVVKEEKENTPEPEIVADKVMDGERITAMDDGTFVPNENVEFEEGHDEGEVEVLNEGQEMPVDGNHPHEVILDEEIGEEAKASGEESQDATDGDLESQDSTTQPGAEEETSWRERWLMNDEVQRVVRSSKVIGKVKKRIASKKKISSQSELVPEVEPVGKEPPLVLEGSVSEYQQLCGVIVGNSLVAEKPTSQQKEVLVGKPVRYVMSQEGQDKNVEATAIQQETQQENLNSLNADENANAVDVSISEKQDSNECFNVPEKEQNDGSVVVPETEDTECLSTTEKDENFLET